MASLMGKVAGAMITRIAADVHRYRATPPAIANTDGDPMCLISATIAVEEGTAGKLAARPDFDRDSDEPDRVTWWGALIPDGQREAMMAEAMAQLRAQGHKDVEAPAGPQRWVRGALRARGREITVEVNSRQRLTRLLDGRTPRQAARGRERPYLEAMPRQFEYEADLLAAEGKTGIDTAWLREQLDMPSDLAD
jgi:hypothetical protein